MRKSGRRSDRLVCAQKEPQSSSNASNVDSERYSKLTGPHVGLRVKDNDNRGIFGEKDELKEVSKERKPTE